MGKYLDKFQMLFIHSEFFETNRVARREQRNPGLFVTDRGERGKQLQRTEYRPHILHANIESHK